ncbi:hypothetical protein CXB51_035195 [Gossypium anomalum]|uniref:DUF7745 domain-containing protein n=1 Tax=Gossypium anomalum TaxID=47600 RepID=A0A8J5Y7H6_9ROSI|nr:hypothetical protein CXB51_035195 [Gossypium anomalum]
MTVVVTPLSGSEKLRLREVFASVQDSGSLSGYIRTYGFSVSKLESFVMENGLLDRVEGNANNNLQELKEIRDQWGNETKQLFYGNYGDLPYLLDVQIDEHLFQALAQFWNPAYSCFTFGEVDLVPTIEEYTALLCCPRFQVDRIYSRAANVPTFWKKLMTITGISEQWITARIKEKGECKWILWDALKGLILTHPDETKKVDVFALSLYGLVVFPRALGYVDEATTDLFYRLSKRVTSVPTILAETFRSLGTCRKAGAGRFVGCAQLLLAWFYSHFRLIDRVICHFFFEDYSPLKDIVASTRRVDVSEENWIVLLQNLQAKDVEGWHKELLAQSEFAYRGADYKKRVGEISSTWNKTCQLKGVAIGPATTPEYVEWRGRRINDNIPEPNMEGARPMEEYLQVMPSELEIMKQEFERKNLELEKKIAKLEEEKMYLSLEIDVQKIEAQVSLRRARVGGSSDQLQKEVHEGKARAEYWEKKFQEMQSRNSVLEEENEGLKSKVTELGRSLRWYRSRDSKVELKELKSKVEDLEAALHKGKLRIEQLETQEDYLKGELHQSRGQVKERDHVMGEAIAQIREVAEYVQDLAVRADVLSLMCGSSSDIGRELALLLDRVKTLGIKAKLLKATDKGKAPMAITEEENEGPPLGFTLPLVPLQTEAPPRRPSATVRP